MFDQAPWPDLDHTKIWKMPKTDEKPAHVGSWFVHAPWMHPVWDNHVVSVVHLRPLNGKPANLIYPEATHEFTVAAQNPNFPPSLDYTQLHPLYPLSVVQQFMAESDVDAIAIIAATLELLVAGKILSLNSDHQDQWKTVLMGTFHTKAM